MDQAKDSLQQRIEDDQAFAIANAILFALTRLFFTLPPLAVLWLFSSASFWVNLAVAIGIGYVMQFSLKALLREED